MSAREATRKIVSATRQLQVLHKILSNVGAPAPSGGAADESPLRAKTDRASWAPRNTIVRDALNEIGNQTGQL